MSPRTRNTAAPTPSYPPSSASSNTPPPASMPLPAYYPPSPPPPGYYHPMMMPNKVAYPKYPAPTSSSASGRALPPLAIPKKRRESPLSNTPGWSPEDYHSPSLPVSPYTGTQSVVNAPMFKTLDLAPAPAPSTPARGGNDFSGRYR